jgi:hypothetical protein
MKNLIYLTLLLTLSIFIGCKHEDTIGPQIADLTVPFNVATPLAVSNNNPDFSTGTTNITAKFDKPAAWKITITGKTSKAMKVFTGSTPDMNVVWNGAADNLPFFGMEECNVVLSFPNFPDKPVQSTVVTIKGLTDPDKGGIIITNCKLSKIKDSEYKDSTYWMSDYPQTTTINTNPTSADGNPYIVMQGAGQNATNPYVDFLSIYPIASDKPYGEFWPLPTDPTRVFFNILVYGSLKDTASHYSDASLNILFNEQNGNQGKITIIPNWEGWRLLSFNYSKLTFTKTDRPQANKIRYIQFVLLTTKPAPFNVVNVKTAFNHLIWTLDKPFGQ